MKKLSQGFTLVEMLVAVFIFSIVMTISTGAIFSMVSANKTSQSLKSVMDNLNSALEDMSRNIRYGTTYHCVTGETVGNESGIDSESSCASGNTLFVYEAKDGSTTTPNDQIVYVFDRTNQAIDRCIGYGSTNCVQMTSPEIKIQDLHFYVTGAGSQTGNDTQPLVLITLHGTAASGNSSSTFNIETLASQRNPECKIDYNGSC